MKTVDKKAYDKKTMMIFGACAFMANPVSFACGLEQEDKTVMMQKFNDEQQIINLINQYPEYQLAKHGYAVIISSSNRQHTEFGKLSYHIRLGYNHPDRFETIVHLYTNLELTQLYLDNVITAEIEAVAK